jgi:hypothetical protein
MGIRDEIIAIASLEIGTPPRSPSREQLDKYIQWSGLPYRDWAQASAGTKTNPSRIKENWCGLFAVYCLRKAGLTSCYWGINSKVNEYTICGPADTLTLVHGTNGIRRGDVAVYKSMSHHFIVDEVVEEYDFVWSYEGNGDAGAGNYGDGSLTKGVLNISSKCLSNIQYYFSLNCD